MTPPPINIDGTDITGATIDGTDVSEVTVDGEAVFSAIPDSTVWQVSAETFSTGDSVWSDDVRSNDMSITGDPQSVTLSSGGAGVEGDGTDDVGLSTIPSELDGSDLNSHAIEFTIESTTTNNDRIGVRNSTQLLFFDFNVDQNRNSDSGNINFSLADSNGNFLVCAFDTAPGFNDGDTHSVLYNVTDASNNNVELYFDGNSKTVAFEAQESPSNWTNWNYDWGTWAINDEGTTGKFINLGFGKIRFHKTSISSPTL